MSDTKDDPIMAALEQKQESACELLDVIEDGLWELCHDVRYLRIRLSQLDSAREKLDLRAR